MKDFFGSPFVRYNFAIGRTDKEQPELKREIDDAKTKIRVGAQYWHYKGKDKAYEIVGLGFLGANDELCVIYVAQYGERLTFPRPLTVWLERVEREGKAVPRFTKL